MSGDHEALPASGVIVASMLTGNTDIALEMIKIGGAALLAYAAGFSNGKAKVKESGDAEKDESYSHPPKVSDKARRRRQYAVVRRGDTV